MSKAKEVIGTTFGAIAIVGVAAWTGDRLGVDDAISSKVSKAGDKFVKKYQQLNSNPGQIDGRTVLPCPSDQNKTLTIEGTPGDRTQIGSNLRLEFSDKGVNLFGTGRIFPSTPELTLDGSPLKAADGVSNLTIGETITYTDKPGGTIYAITSQPGSVKETRAASVTLRCIDDTKPNQPAILPTDPNPRRT